MKLSTFSNRLKKLTPGQVLVIYYALAILAGAFMLSLPQATVGEPLSFLDALFTATSAQCVTGLTVVDTGTRLSLFGQSIVLLLIQIGGLGIMTFSVYLFIYLRVGLSVRGRFIINETLMHTPISSWRALVRDIIAMTLLFEAVGAGLLAIVFVPELGFWAGLYSAVFHAVSAFCNAGFSLFGNSLVDYRDNALVNGTVIALIVLGGIGFLVIRELYHGVRERRRGSGKNRVRLSLHSKMVLVTTAFLIVSGTVLIALLESNDSLAGMSFAEGGLTALFQAVTARTAGFHTLDLNLFREPTLLLMVFLMFVGASPGSAGGGVKTTSLALFFAIFYGRLKGESRVCLFRRTIPDEAITKALALVLLALILIGFALFGLMVVQGSDPAHEKGREFLSYLFETFSAFGTVGLSLGATAKLTAPGKGIIIVLMFVGRVGLLTTAFAIAGRKRRYTASYAEENIMIG